MANRTRKLMKVFNLRLCLAKALHIAAHETPRPHLLPFFNHHDQRYSTVSTTGLPTKPTTFVFVIGILPRQQNVFLIKW